MESFMPITQDQLQAYVGKTIAEICPNAFTAPTQNHCAHFVSHALGLQLGMLCGDMAYKTRHSGTSIRCDELYNKLSDTGPWDDKLMARDGMLIFVLAAKNVVKGVMMNVPQKHVGIYAGGKVYNFSNNQHMVVADPSVETFHKKFKLIYAGNDISLFYGIPV
jgi:hypothetical protein